MGRGGVIALCVVLAVLAMACAVAVAFIHRPEAAVAPTLPDTPWLESKAKQFIVVHQTPAAGGESYRGVLECADPDGVLLRAVELLQGGNKPSVKVAGECYFPRDQVAFVQLPG